jgi:hypothetical protein
MGSRDFSMSPLPNKEPAEIKRNDQPKKALAEAANASTMPTGNFDDALFIARVRIEGSKKLIQQLMTEEDKYRTGLAKLSEKELANLNAWLDPRFGGVVALVGTDSSGF